MSEKNCAPGWQAKGAAVSGSDDSVGTVELHEQSHLQPRVALSAVIAEAVAAGALQIGGRFELRSGRLRREAGR